MLRSRGIPCKHQEFHKCKGYHAEQVYLADEDRWATVDTTYDSVLIEAAKSAWKRPQYSKTGILAPLAYLYTYRFL